MLLPPGPIWSGSKMQRQPVDPSLFTTVPAASTAKDMHSAGGVDYWFGLACMDRYSVIWRNSSAVGKSMRILL